MKKLFLVACIASFFVACSSENCKECNGCKTKADAELCEEDFEKTSDFNDQVDNYVSDGCTCSDK